MSDLWTAYLNHDPGLAPFFTHPPGDWASVVEARRRMGARPLDHEAIDEIARANAQWGVAPCVVERAFLLGRNETVVIATGQQAGLLGGPLYTSYKAIAAVRWAERLERDLGISIVPIFWVASDDDDLDEVRSFRWQNAEGKWGEYGYQPAQHRPGMPVYDVPIEPKLRDDLAQVFAQLHQTEFTADLAQRINAIAAEANDLEAFFIRILAWLLGERAPLFISPRMSWVRRSSAVIIERELGEAGESSRRIIEAGNRLRALGFHPGLHRRPQHVNCFVLDGGLRHKILATGERFEVIAPTGGRRATDAAQLRSELASNPARFSPNVVTRPIVQDLALPTLAYVAGPGEVSYFAQMRGVYEMFGIPMPIILPRPQVCLIEPRVERALAKLGVAVERVAASSPEQFDTLVRNATRPSATKGQLDVAQQRMNEALEFVGSQADLSDPAVARSYERLRNAVRIGLEKLASRQRERSLSHDTRMERAFTTARESLWPAGLPQERGLTIFLPFLNLFGTQLILRLAEAIRLDAKDVQPIVLSLLMAGKGKS